MVTPAATATITKIQNSNPLCPCTTIHCRVVRSVSYQAIGILIVDPQTDKRPAGIVDHMHALFELGEDSAASKRRCIEVLFVTGPVERGKEVRSHFTCKLEEREPADGRLTLA
jgi:hypothetical protein